MKIGDIIEERLKKELQPEHLELINESALHRGHSGDDGSGESHFKLIVVSSCFDGMPRIERHRLIHRVLGPKITSKIHALSISAVTPAECK